MTRRSIQNDRNMGDGPDGVSKKSASKAKPVKKAASTVYTPSNKKSRKELKREAELREQRKRERNAAKFGVRDDRGSIDLREKSNKEIKKWRRIWWASLGVAIVSILLSYLSAQSFTSLYFVFIALSYAGIIFALYIEFGKIRKLRKKAEQTGGYAKKSPKQLKHELEAMKLEEARRVEKKQRGLLGRFKKKKQTMEDLPMDE